MALLLLCDLHVCVCVWIDWYGECSAAANGMHSDTVPTRQCLPLCSPRCRHPRTM